MRNCKQHRLPPASHSSTQETDISAVFRRRMSSNARTKHSIDAVSTLLLLPHRGICGGAELGKFVCDHHVLTNNALTTKGFNTTKQVWLLPIALGKVHAIALMDIGQSLIKDLLDIRGEFSACIRLTQLLTSLTPLLTRQR